MDNDFQHRVMQTFHYALRPGGYLFIGPSESVSRESRLFTAADKKHRVLQRRDSVRAALPEFLPSPRTATALPAPIARTEDQIDRSARRATGKTHSPAYFVIDRHHNIVRFPRRDRPLSRAVGRQRQPELLHQPGKALRSQVRRAVEAAFVSGRLVEEENMRIDGGDQFVDLLVEPIAESGRPAEMVVVAFRERRPRATPERGADTPSAILRDVDALQQELHVPCRLAIKPRASKAGKPDRKHEIGDRGIPISQTGEKLQSSNEELETAKEEMQSVNEELPDHQWRTARQERAVDAGQQRSSEPSRQHANRNHLSR